MPVGDVTLHALDGEVARERAAAAVLDHVAGFFDRGRFADDAVIHFLAALLERFDYAHGAVDRRAFFVGGKQHRERARMIGVLRNEIGQRDDERRERAFHVGSAAPVEHAVPDRRRERIARPLLDGPVGTTSVWPAKHTSGAAVPRRAHRLSTPPWLIFSHSKPSGFKCSISRSMQPASSGVTERREINCWARSRVLMVTGGAFTKRDQPAS